MRTVINLVLAAIAAALIWVLVTSISEPIAFGDELGKRQDAVISRLKDIRTAQQLYRDVTGEGFAPTFDTLDQVIRNGQIPIVSVFGDPDDPNFDGVIRYDTTFRSALDSAMALGLPLDSLRFVPFTDGQQFKVQADTTTYQSTLVNVVEVSTNYKYFMGPYTHPRFQRYDNTYDPNKTIKFGNMSTPSVAGNWE
ncbi:MAG: hypothetical protein AB8F78_11490 [Saprospiraceae bacterium]